MPATPRPLPYAVSRVRPGHHGPDAAGRLPGRVMPATVPGRPVAGLAVLVRSTEVRILPREPAPQGLHREAHAGYARLLRRLRNSGHGRGPALNLPVELAASPYIHAQAAVVAVRRVLPGRRGIVLLQVGLAE